MSKTKEVKNGLVVKIMVALGLGDEGRIGKFFAKEIKKANTAIKGLKHNLAAEKSQYEIAKEKLQDALEDAKEALEAAYENVTPESVATNAAMEEFSYNYWDGVADAEATVTWLESELETLEKKFKEGGSADGVSFQGSDYINKQIDKYETRISKIS